jgi:uncharacterized protein (TIGR03437 family)
VPTERIGYAGVAPGWGGLYQINVRLPDVAGVKPEIRIAVGDEASPAELTIWAGPAVF